MEGTKPLTWTDRLRYAGGAYAVEFSSFCISSFEDEEVFVDDAVDSFFNYGAGSHGAVDCRQKAHVFASPAT